MDGQAISEALKVARSRWPQLELSESAFRARAEQAIEAAAGTPSHLSDLFLAEACTRNIAGAVAEFETRYFGDLRAALSEIDRDKTFIDDVLQRLRIALFLGSETSDAKLKAYGGRGDLYSWTRVVAVRTAISLKRSGQRISKREVLLDEIDAGELTDDPAIEKLKEKYASEFREAITSALGGLEPRERTLLRLTVVDQLSAEKVAQLRGVHRTTVWRQIREVRDRLGALTRERLQDQLALSADPTELESVFRLIASRLDVTLADHLKTQTD